MSSPRSSRVIALGLALAAIAPATAAASQDLRSPDASDPFTAPAASVDLRSPDASDPFTAPAARVDLRSPDASDPFTAPAASVDLRAPDSRDVAERHSAGKAPTTMVVRMPQRTHATGGTDWSDVGMGAGGAFAVLALSAGGAVLVQRRRHVRTATTA